MLQSLRRPCSHLPWPDAACSAFSTSRAERGPTPQHCCRHSHTQTHTHTRASFHSVHELSTRAVGHHTTDSLCSAQPSLTSPLFQSLPLLLSLSVTLSFTHMWSITFVNIPLTSARFLQKFTDSTLMMVNISWSFIKHGSALPGPAA